MGVVVGMVMMGVDLSATLFGELAADWSRPATQFKPTIDWSRLATNRFASTGEDQFAYSLT